MTGEEIVALCQKAQEGDETALETLIVAFKPLVAKMAHRRYNSHRYPTPLTVDDLVAAGTEAVWNAVMSYDPQRGTFYALASTSIRNAIERVMNELGTPVRTPATWAETDAPHLFYADALDGTECISDGADLRSEEICDTIREVMNTILNAQERRIVMESFGFLGPPKTLREQGKIIDRTHARVGQILAIALSKIKNDPRVQQTAAAWL